MPASFNLPNTFCWAVLSGVLSEIVQVLRGFPQRRLSVEGHTDSLGTVAANKRLSEARAQAVLDELVTQGISRRRAVSRGFGESNPTISNSTALGREKNRRVEVVIDG